MDRGPAPNQLPPQNMGPAYRQDRRPMQVEEQQLYRIQSQPPYHQYHPQQQQQQQN